MGAVQRRVQLRLQTDLIWRSFCEVCAREATQFGYAVFLAWTRAIGGVN